MVKKLLIIGLCITFLGCNQNKNDTVTKDLVDSPTLATPAFILSPVAEDLITDAEVSAISKNHGYYDKHYQTATFAGSGSGPTIAIGVDLGMNSAEYTTSSWSSYFSANIVSRFATCSGDTSVNVVKEDINKLQDISIIWSTALKEFNSYEIPNYYQLSLRTFPGLDNLTINAQSAIVSVVYNRGSSMVGPSRVDMRTLRDAVTSKDYSAMSAAILHMNITMGPAWQQQGIYDGMVTRRKAESKLILTPDS